MFPFSLEIVMKWDVEVCTPYTLTQVETSDRFQTTLEGTSVEMRTFIPIGWSLMLYHNTEIASSNNLLRICLQ